MMIPIEFAKFVITNRRYYGGLILFLTIFGLVLESDVNWRFWAILISFLFYVIVEFISWFMTFDGQPESNE